MSKNCTPLWGEAHFQVKMFKKTDGVGALFEGLMSKKLHAAVARSTFTSQNVEKTDGVGALFEGPMSKNYTTLWREAHV